MGAVKETGSQRTVCNSIDVQIMFCGCRGEVASPWAWKPRPYSPNVYLTSYSFTYACNGNLLMRPEPTGCTRRPMMATPVPRQRENRLQSVTVNGQSAPYRSTFFVRPLGVCYNAADIVSRRHIWTAHNWLI